MMPDLYLTLYLLWSRCSLASHLCEISHCWKEKMYRNESMRGGNVPHVHWVFIRLTRACDPEICTTDTCNVWLYSRLKDTAALQVNMLESFRSHTRLNCNCMFVWNEHNTFNKFIHVHFHEFTYEWQSSSVLMAVKQQTVMIGWRIESGVFSVLLTRWVHEAEGCWHVDWVSSWLELLSDREPDPHWQQFRTCHRVSSV